MKDLQDNFSYYARERIVRLTVGYGEVAAFARSMKANGVKLDVRQSGKVLWQLESKDEIEISVFRRPPAHFFSSGAFTESLAQTNQEIKMAMQETKACQNLTQPDLAVRACSVFIDTDRYRSVMKRVPTLFPLALILRSGAYSKLGKPELAIADANRGLQLGVMPAAFYLMRGTIHSDAGETAKAMADIDQGIKSGGDKGQMASLYRTRGNLHFYVRNELDKALSDFNDSVRFDPKFAGTYVMRGSVYAIRGDDQRADADYQMAMKLDPGQRQTYVTARELVRRWVRYLKEIQDDNDYANWSGPPLDLFQNASATRSDVPCASRQETSADQSCALAANHWTSTESIGTLVAFEDYLARFPNCTFATLARARIAALTQKTAK